MKKPFLKWATWSWMLLLPFAPCVNAVIVPQVYEANLPCQTQDPQEREQLIQQGLQQVLDRMNADGKSRNHAHIQRALAHATDYVEQYSYQDNQLIIKYSASLLDKLTSNTGSTVWGQNRPNVVLWLVLEQNGDRHLIGAESDPQLHKQIQQMAKARGLPLILPMMDLEDVSAVSATDVWGQFPDVLRHASTRYNAQIILVGRVVKRNSAEPLWESTWQLLMQDKPLTWQAQGSSLEGILGQGITGATQNLMARYGVKANHSAQPGTPFTLQVQRVSSAADLIKVERYLQSLNEVNRAYLSKLDGHTATFEITPKGENGRDILAQTLEVDHKMTADRVNQELAQSSDMVYRWGQ